MTPHTRKAVGLQFYADGHRVSSCWVASLCRFSAVRNAEQVLHVMADFVRDESAPILDVRTILVRVT